MRTTHIIRTFAVQLTPLELAAEFCELFHEDQAKVLIEIARIIDGYDTMAHNLVPLYIGRELFKSGDGTSASELLGEILDFYGPSPDAQVAAPDPRLEESDAEATPRPVTKSCYCCTCRSEEYGSDDPYCRNHGHAGVRQCVKHGSTDAKQGVDEDGKAIATCQQVWEAKSWSTADKLLASPSSPPGESQRGEGE